MSLAYATIQRKVIPQLAGLMTLEQQGLLRTGMLSIPLDFDLDTIQDAVREVAIAHNYHFIDTMIMIGSVQVQFFPKSPK